MQLNGLKLNKLAVLLVFFLMTLLASGCNENNPDNPGTQSPDTGPAALEILWHGTASHQQDLTVVKPPPLNCQDAGVEKVVVKVYDAANNHLLTTGPGPCTDSPFAVDGIPIGAARRFVVLTEDAFGNVRYNGQTDGTAINPGEPAQEPVVVQAYPFTPALTSPDNEIQVDSNTVTLSWDPVDNAEEYKVQLADNIGFENEIVNETTPALELAPTNLEPGKRYYWKVSAVDAYKNLSTVSETSTFTTLDLPMISGAVLTASGDAITGVTITFETADGTGTVTTDDSGTYRRAVPEGWTGIVKPSSDRYEFNPASENVPHVTEDVEQNFTATAITPTISGRIEQASDQNHGIGGITIEFTNGGGSATTSDDGAYSIAVPYNWTGTAEPVSDRYNFDPTSRPYPNNTTGDLTDQNFTGADNTRTLSGRVRDKNDPDQGYSDVTVTVECRPPDTPNASVTTDSYTTGNDGNFQVTAPYGDACTIYGRRNLHDIRPHTIDLNTVTQDRQELNFEGERFRPAVSGRVVSGADPNVGVPHVTLTFGNEGSVTTDANGNYTTTVTMGWTGTVTLSTDRNYRFEQERVSLKNVTSNRVIADFIVTGVEISGRIVDSDSPPLPPLPTGNITVEFENVGTTTTDAAGNYSTLVPYGWSGLATPRSEGLTFDPPSILLNKVLLTRDAQEFTGTRIRLNISGFIYDEAGDPFQRVMTVDAIPGGGSSNVLDTGYYSVEVPYGWTGSIVPSNIREFDFVPKVNYDDNNRVTQDHENVNFTGINPPIVMIFTNRDVAEEANSPNGMTGQYRIERKRSLRKDLDIHFIMGGSAQRGADYTLQDDTSSADITFAETIRMPSGLDHITITLIAADDTETEQNETAELILEDCSDCRVGYPYSATVQIVSDDELQSLLQN